MKNTEYFLRFRDFLRHAYSIIYCTVFLLFFINVATSAQPRLSHIQIIVAPDHADWTYHVGDTAIFNVTVLKSSIPLDSVTIFYHLNPDRMPAIKKENLFLEKGKTQIKGSMKKPGFLRCFVEVKYNGHNYSNYATAGFDPTSIQPTTTLPDDFTAFWDSAKKELSSVPLEYKIRLLPDISTDKVNVFEVNIKNIKGRIYGLLALPKEKGQYPALLNLPGAGVYPRKAHLDIAEEGIITFTIDINGIPPTLDPEIYKSLGEGALKNYWFTNLDDKNEYYYKRVYLGCIRAVDFIFSLPEFDGKNIAVYGGSQGGGLSLVTAGLDQRIKYLGVFYPALCDLTGFLYGRAGGWPLLFRNPFTNKPDKVETSKYYDAVNFARFIKIPGFYSSGYNDRICPPTSTFSAYNTIKATKKILIVPETRHYSFPEQYEEMKTWFIRKLLNK